MRVLGIVLSAILATAPAMPAGTPKIPLTAQVTPVSPPPAAQPITEAEAEELSKRDEAPGKEIKGGALTNMQLTYIVIALAAAVIVLIAVQ